MKTMYQNVWATDKSVFIGKFITLNLCRDRSHTTMVNILKTQQTFSKKCGRYQESNTVWEDRDFHESRGSSVGTGGRVTLVSRLGQFSRKRLKPQRLCWGENAWSPSIDLKRMLAIKRCKHATLGGDNKRKCFELHLLCYYKGNKILRLCSLWKNKLILRSLKLMI